MKSSHHVKALLAGAAVVALYAAQPVQASADRGAQDGTVVLASNVSAKPQFLHPAACTCAACQAALAVKDISVI